MLFLNYAVVKKIRPSLCPLTLLVSNVGRLRWCFAFVYTYCVLLGLFCTTVCDSRCIGCKGPGPGNCLACAEGYKDDEGTCTGTHLAQTSVLTISVFVLFFIVLICLLILLCFLSLLDVDECELPDSVCKQENQECVNTNGSYKCRCAGGFEEHDGVCVQQAQPGIVCL